ncbi:DPP IV N-terminal domain-containing protein [Streptomyces sp. M19]
MTGGALHVVRPDGTGDTARRARGPEVTYGLAEYVAAESMGRTRGYWWAPDGDALLVARVDPTRWACATSATRPTPRDGPARSATRRRAPRTRTCHCTW